MGKIKIKRITTGAPLYMSQFTMIMLILIVMCMIMSTLAKKQDAGFQRGEDGFGKKRSPNALGIMIMGPGQFRFGSYGNARSYSPNPGEKTTDETQNPHADTVKGEGGSGNSDLDLQKADKVKYLFFKLALNFPDKTSEITPEISERLNKIALALNLFEFEIIMKVYAHDYGDDVEKNTQIGWNRAGKIIQIFNKVHNVPLSDMNFLVYTDRKYFGTEQADAKQENMPPAAPVPEQQETPSPVKQKIDSPPLPEQEIFFYFKIHSSDRGKKK